MSSSKSCSSATVAFLRGANVGGHRRVQPSLVAKQLGRFDVVNIGATGLFVFRRPDAEGTFRAELLRRLPFATQVAFCKGADLLALEGTSFFDGVAPDREHVRFVSVLTGAPSNRLPPMPFGIPSDDDWYVRMLGRKKEFVFGVYRRHMKTISYLGRIDKALGAPATTRRWSTIETVLKVLKS